MYCNITFANYLQNVGKIFKTIGQYGKALYVIDLTLAINWRVCATANVKLHENRKYYIVYVYALVDRSCGAINYVIDRKLNEKTCGKIGFTKRTRRHELVFNVLMLRPGKPCIYTADNRRYYLLYLTNYERPVERVHIISYYTHSGVGCRDRGTSKTP